MVNEYQSNPGFKNWRKKAMQNLEANFPHGFWMVETRNRVIHLIGNLRGEIVRKVATGVTLKGREDGSMYAYRDDPPQDNRLRFATRFHGREGGNVIVERCKDYLAALTQMIDDWEDRSNSSSSR